MGKLKLLSDAEKIKELEQQCYMLALSMIQILHDRGEYDADLEKIVDQYGERYGAEKEPSDNSLPS